MKNRILDWSTIAVFIVALVVTIAIFPDFGLSWDEEVQNEYGHRVLRYYTSGLTDSSHAEYRNLYLYGGLFDSIASLLNKFSPFGEFETRHLLNALTGLLGVVGAVLLARRVAGPLAGLFTALLLLLTPTYFGHLFTNPKDIPFSTGYIWTLYFAYCWLKETKFTFRRAVGLGAALGLTLGVRVGGLVMLPYLFAFGGLAILRREKTVGSVAATLGVAFLVAWLIMLLCWPWAQTAPITHPLWALGALTHFRQFATLIFDGEVFSTFALPNDYLWRYLLIKLPPLVLGLGLIQIFRMVRGARRDPTPLLIPVAFLFPLFYVTIRKSVLYDEMRHLLFVIPPLAILGGIFLSQVKSRAAAGAVVALFLVNQLVVIYRLHPYQYVYYNFIVGNLAGAQDRYETDYWAESYREAVKALAGHVARSGDSERVVKVLVCGPTLSATYYFPPNFELAEISEPTEKASLDRRYPIKDTGDADYFISFTRNGCNYKVSGREIIRVEREGALLSVVKDLRGYPKKEDWTGLRRVPPLGRPNRS